MRAPIYETLYFEGLGAESLTELGMAESGNVIAAIGLTVCGQW
jgi:hypothetical protein